MNNNSRVLTVLFTDIAGFTAKTSRSSREEFHNYLDKHDQILKPIFLRFNGKIIKTIGDAFMVTFESPTNAVVCAVFIQDELKAYNERVSDEEKIQVRIAINAGEVEERDGDVFGEPVNIASRIESITDPGEIYFTEAVYLAMNKSEVPTCEVGQKMLKGIPVPVKVYRVASESNLYVSKLKEHYSQFESKHGLPSVEIKKSSPKPKTQKKRSVLSYVGIFFAILVLLLIVFRFLQTEEGLARSIESGLKAKRNTHHIILAYYDQYGNEEKVIAWHNQSLINEIYVEISKDPQVDPLELKEHLEIIYGRYHWNLKDFEVFFNLGSLFDEKSNLRTKFNLVKKAYNLSGNLPQMEDELYRLMVAYPSLLNDSFNGSILFNYHKRQNRLVASQHVEAFLNYVLENDGLFLDEKEKNAFLKQVLSKDSLAKLLFHEKPKIRLLAFDLSEEWLTPEKKLEVYSHHLFNLDDGYIDMQNRSFLYLEGVKNTDEWKNFKTTPFYASVIKVNGLPQYGDKDMAIKKLLVEIFSPEIIEKAKAEFGKNIDYFDRLHVFEFLEIANELNEKEKWEFHKFSLLKTTMKYLPNKTLSKALVFFKNSPKEKLKETLVILEEGVSSITIKCDQYKREGQDKWASNATINLKQVKDLLAELNKK